MSGGRGEAHHDVGHEETPRADARRELDRLASLQRLAVEISTRCFAAPTDAAAKVLDTSLPELAAALRADRMYVIAQEPGAARPTIAHEWQRPGVGSVAGVLARAPLPLIEQMRASTAWGDPVAIGSLADVPGELATAVALMREVGTEAHLSAALPGTDPGWASLVVDVVGGARQWYESERWALRLVADAFGALLARSRLEAREVEHERLLRAILDSSPDTITVVDRDGRYLAAGASIIAAGGARARPRGHTPHEIGLDAAFATALDEANRRVVATGAPTELLAPYPGPLGTRWVEMRLRPVVEDGVVTAVVRVGRDVTDRIAQDAALADLGARLDATLRALGQAVVRMRLPDWSIHYCSPSLADVLGVAPARLVGPPDPWPALVVAEERAALHRQRRTLLRDGRAELRGHLVGDDGRRRAYRCILQLVRDEHGDPVAAEGVVYAAADEGEGGAALLLGPADERRDEASRRLAYLEHQVRGIARELDRSGLVTRVGDPVHVAFLAGIQQLSKREREVLDLLASGRSPASIAEHFGVSRSTVRNQLSSVYRKLGVASQAELRERLGVLASSLRLGGDAPT